MKYLLMIRGDEAEEEKISDEDMGQILEEYGKFSIEAAEAGVLVDGMRLQPSTTATTVQVRDGQVKSTDGPYAEVKEQIGGYFIVDVANLDEAIKWASKIPSAKFGTIEILPAWEGECG